MNMSDLSFKYGWRKPISLNFKANSINIDCVFNAFKGEEITEDQKQSFKIFNEKKAQYEVVATELINEYIEENSISNSEVHPVELMFNRDGEFALLCDCSWDTEHGIAVVLYPQPNVVMQDEFL